MSITEKHNQFKKSIICQGLIAAQHEVQSLIPYQFQTE